MKKLKKDLEMEEMDEEFKKAPLQEHYNELRIRLLMVVLSWFFATLISFYFAEEIFAFLAKPLIKILNHNRVAGDHRLIYTSLTEGLMTYFKLSCFSGVIIAHPIIISQLYFFIAPGLYKREKAVLIPYMIAAPILFMTGAAIVYYLVVPAAWEFFLSFETKKPDWAIAIILEAKISEYLDLMIEMIVGFGIAFQLPVIISLLARLKIVTSGVLIRIRKYAIVMIFIAAAILTPPDVLSQIILALPLILLYEISIIICKVIEKKKDNA